MGTAEDDADTEVKEHPDANIVKDVENTTKTVITHTVPAVEQAFIKDQNIPPTFSAQDDAGIDLKVDISDNVYKSAVDDVNHVGCNNEDKSNLYSLDALVAEYKQKKGENQEDVSKTGTPTVKNNDSSTNSDKLTSNQAVDTGILEHKNVTYNKLSGVMFDDEDSSVSSEEKKRIEFMHCVGFSHIHKLSIPILQVPEISDSGIQENTSELRSQMFQQLTNKPAPEVSSGLESLIDGSKTHEMDKLLLDMVPKVEANKRKKVSFADGPSKKMKEESVSVVPSPSRYRTRSAAREEMTSSPQKKQDLG
jgi:hypothetical protein